jgi:ribosomal protein L40E
MSVGNNRENLGAVAEQLKQLADDIQEQYESFVDATELYKKGKVNQQDFMPKLADYLVRSTALSSGAIEVLFELKLAIEKNLSNAPVQANKPMDVISSPSFSTAVTNSTKSGSVKICKSCASTIHLRAKFCNKCGKSQ